jgi:hypothetical protein
MIRRVLLTSVFLILGTVAMAPKTMAQTANIPFTGNVAGACNFGEITPGTLIPSGSASSTTSPTISPTRLSAGASFGPSSPNAMPGRVFIICNQSANLVVSKPVQTAGPTFTPMISDAKVFGPSGTTSASTAPLRLMAGTTTTPLSVEMMVDKGGPLVPGTYGYRVTLTVTP